MTVADVHSTVHKLSLYASSSLKEVEIHPRFLLLSRLISRLAAKLHRWKRQKRHQLFHPTSDCCEFCNPHSCYHTSNDGARLVDKNAAEMCKLSLFTYPIPSAWLKYMR